MEYKQCAIRKVRVDSRFYKHNINAKISLKRTIQNLRRQLCGLSYVNTQSVRGIEYRLTQLFYCRGRKVIVIQQD